MRVQEKRVVLWLLLSAHLYSGLADDALPYDYIASLECLENPHKPQYGGGIILNPELNHGLKGWSGYGGSEIENRASEGNSFIVAHSRKQVNDSIAQKVYLHKDKLYTFSAWIQVSKGITPVAAVFRTNYGHEYAGAVAAESGCWSMLKGGLTVNSSGPAHLYFESEDTSVEIWVDSISLQPFTKEQWTSHQNQSIEKTRKRKVKLEATDANGNPVAGAKIVIKQNKPNFPFGNAISKHVLTNTAYQNWFTSRFTVTVFENELKWYSTEYSRGKEDYSVADAMFQFAKQNGLTVRGHNILWDNEKYQPSWVPSLSETELDAAVRRRIESVVQRYSGQIIGWDVMNENLHFSFFESRLGPEASGGAFQMTRRHDRRTTLFLNEYDTIENSGEVSASPDKYLQKLTEMQYFLRGDRNLGIGLQGHFRTPNIPYMRSAIDKLAATNFPIWITELDVDPSQPKYLDEVLREVHAHPAIKGIVMWAAWSPEGCFRMCLTDNNFKNTPTGDVVDKLLQDWTHAGRLVGTADADGVFETSLFHGDYETRKTKVRIQAIDGRGNPLPNAIVKDHQQKLSFPFGNAMNKHILNDPAHQNWFTSTFTAFENELKWYSNEASAGKEDYSAADALFQFAEQHKIAVRGHNIIWNDAKYQPGWLVSLPPDQIRSAADRRVDSVVRRYVGRINSWGVMNENLHFTFFEDKLGGSASADFFQKTRQIDGKSTLFMNEYNTLENSQDPLSTPPAKYLEKLRSIQSFYPNIGSLGIGLQSHFRTTLDLAYVRSSLDTLAAAKLPIWITELDVESSPNQVSYLEQILSEMHAYPAIEGIVMWAARSPEGCFRMCLTDNQFKNLPTGDVVDKLINQWKRGFVGMTGSDGFLETSLFHGDYEVSVTHPTLMKNSTLVHEFKVAPIHQMSQQLEDVMVVKLTV